MKKMAQIVLTGPGLELETSEYQLEAGPKVGPEFWLDFLSA